MKGMKPPGLSTGKEVKSAAPKLREEGHRSSYPAGHLSGGGIYSRRSEPGVWGAKHANEMRSAAPQLKENSAELACKPDSVRLTS